MSKLAELFESRGVERQYSAHSPQSAQRAFATSCAICSTRGVPLECGRCGIADAHNSVMTILFNAKGA
jgi:hypothetical protein